MYFPRVLAFDRLRGRVETFALLRRRRRHDRALRMRPGRCGPPPRARSRSCGRDCARRAPCPDAERVTPLAGRRQHAAVGARRAVRRASSPRTLAAGGCGAADWKYLSARRLALFVAASIEQGTRWVLFEHNAPATWERARAQVEAFLEALDAAGRLRRHVARGELFRHLRRARQPRRSTVAEGKFNLLFGFATSKPGEFDAWLVTHQPARAACRPVSVNRSATSRQRVEWEIETAILRGLALVGPAVASAARGHDAEFVARLDAPRSVPWRPASRACSSARAYDRLAGAPAARRRRGRRARCAGDWRAARR